MSHTVCICIHAYMFIINTRRWGRGFKCWVDPPPRDSRHFGAFSGRWSHYTVILKTENSQWAQNVVHNEPRWPKYDQKKCPKIPPQKRLPLTKKNCSYAKLTQDCAQRPKTAFTQNLACLILHHKWIIRIHFTYLIFIFRNIIMNVPGNVNYYIWISKHREYEINMKYAGMVNMRLDTSFG